MKATKDIIVLTGAGQLGMAIARRMGHGKTIFVADWKLENVNSIAKTMKEAGFDVIPFKVDISSRHSVIQLIEAAQKEGPYYHVHQCGRCITQPGTHRADLKC